MIDALPLLLGPEGYQISRSVRLRSSASAYFNRTPASAGNRKTWTWSGWVKRGGLGARQTLFSVFDYLASPPTNNQTVIEFTAADTLGFFQFSTSTYNGQKTTTQVFRDPSAWYHIVAIWDTTQATASSRMRLFVNGVQITAFGTSSDPSLNADGEINRSVLHNIGTFYDPDFGAPSVNLDGYLTEINFIDGQALTPSSFGETDSITGVWKPKKYTGTYGTNGFFLTFQDNSAATATTIGKDYSGNSNNWTPNNISVTAGTTYDSMLDVPTLWADGGNGRGNYAVMNPLQTGSYVTQSNGNLTNTGNTATNSALVLASIGQLTSGKWYWEYTQGTVQSETCGVCTQDMSGVSLLNGENIGAYGVGVRASGTVYGGTVGSITSWTAGDVIGIAVDCDNGAAYWSKNGTWLNSGVPTSGSSKTGAVGTWTPSPTKLITPAFGAYNGGSVSATFGQRPFSYTPPSGFKALNTLNLPAPTILKGNQYFDATTYTGTGASRSVTNAGAFQPDFVWLKLRSGADSHALFDAVRGAGYRLQSNDTGSESLRTDVLTSFNSNGFSISGSDSQSNANGSTYVGWQWKEGATQGFDIVTFTKSTTNQTVNHSLGVAPAMIIVKGRGPSTSNWLVYHRNANASPQNGGLALEQTAAFTSNAGYWNNTSPTSTQFSIGSFLPNENSVAYLFSEVAGFSRFGSYTGNGSTDGPFVFCGFRPRWILRKGIVTAGVNWSIHDTARGTTNVITSGLLANTSGAETSLGDVDVTANGFKMRSSSFNDGSEIYIFAAFAEHPFKNALAR